MKSSKRKSRGESYLAGVDFAKRAVEQLRVEHSPGYVAPYQDPADEFIAVIPGQPHTFVEDLQMMHGYLQSHDVYLNIGVNSVFRSQPEWQNA